MTEPRGFSLIELLLVLGIMAILTSLVIPGIQQLIGRAKIAKAIGDIEAIGIELDTFQAGADSLPMSLAAISRAGYLDPWGNAYQYLRFPKGGGGKGKGGGGPPAGARKDRFLVPINSSYDLYSMGKDGATAAPLTAKASRDDIVRANDGGFVGLAARY